jgi:hypothetical protein
MMKRIQIETAANGYIATDTSYRDEAMCVQADPPHVFEAFDSLVKWLDRELAKPKSSNQPDP